MLLSYCFFLGGDYNDLDSIEPMTESGDVSVALMASHQQQMQQQQVNAQQHQSPQQQQQMYYNRVPPPQNRYEMQSQLQQHGYMRQVGNAPAYIIQQPIQSQGGNMFMSPPPQPNCSPSPYTPHQSPQKETTPYQRQRVPVRGAGQYAVSPVRTPMSAPPAVHAHPQSSAAVGRTDDLHSSRSG